MADDSTIGIKDYYRDVIKPRYEKNIRVAKEVFGLEVLGYTYVSWEEGDALAYAPDEFDWVEEHQLEPVFLKECYCNKWKKHPFDKKVFGHRSACVAPVPDYFGNIADAWLIIRKFVDEKGWDFNLNCDSGEEWRCQLGGSDYCTAVAKTPEAAICLAALACMRKEERYGKSV